MSSHFKYDNNSLDNLENNKILFDKKQNDLQLIINNFQLINELSERLSTFTIKNKDIQSYMDSYDSIKSEVLKTIEELKGATNDMRMLLNAIFPPKCV